MDRRIAAALAHIDRCLADDIRVRDLAAAVHLSPSRFAHLFQVELGVAPHEFIKTQRMTRARVLLERTFLTVKEVMALVGCNDTSHFTRDFRRQHGLSPREWRFRYGPHAASRPPPEPPFHPQQNPPTNSRMRPV